MPSKVLQALAKKKGVSSREVEEYWKKAKEIVKNEYHKEEPSDDSSQEAKENFYRLVMGVVKKMMGQKKNDHYDLSALSPLGAFRGRANIS